MSETCQNIMTMYPVYHLSHTAVGAFLFTIAIMYFVNSGIILYWIKKQEDEAKNGDHKAVKSTIFPVFVDVMWFNAAVNAYTSAVMLMIDQPQQGGDHLSALMWASFFGLSHMVNEGVAYMLIQKGLGRNTQRQVLRRSIVWGFICFVVRYFTYLRVRKEEEGSMVFILLFWKSLMVLFYGAVALVPSKHLYRRPAATYFARIWACWQILNLISSVLIAIRMASPIGLCVELFGAFLIYAIVQPIAIYSALLKDSEWWQGQFEQEYLEDDATGPMIDRLNSSKSVDIVSPLAGLNINLHSAQTLADCIDQMITEKGVKLLNFAYVQLNEDQLLGQGAFSKVYRGTYRCQECAIKLVFTFDLTVDIIRRVAAEAQILTSLKHPNIIHTFGVAVMPPSVCLLLEICEYGSLSDVLRGKVDDQEEVSQPALPLSYADMLHLALGCARGLSAMHRLGKQVCHRDVKSLNFLVDCQLTAKLADLELGTGSAVEDKPTFPVLHSIQKMFQGMFAAPTADTHGKFAKRRSSAARLSVYRHSISYSNHDMGSVVSAGGPTSDVGSITSLDAKSFANSITKKPQALNVLPHWMAPEVLRQLSSYSQSSDVYSFGVVLWELLSKKLPYEGIEDHGQIRDMIIAGERLKIESVYGDGAHALQLMPMGTLGAVDIDGKSLSTVADTDTDDVVDSRLRELIDSMWQEEPEDRPTMEEVTVRLEELLRATWSDHITGAHPAIDTTTLFPVQKTTFALGLARPPAAARSEARTKVVEDVQNNIKWAEFEKSLGRKGIYAVATSSAPHFLLRASYHWYSEFGFSPSDLGKLELLNAIMTENHGPKSTLQNIQKVDLKQSFSYDLQGEVQNCVVLELENRKTGHVGLYSVHCFPLSCDAHKTAAMVAGYADRLVQTHNADSRNRSNSSGLGGSYVESRSYSNGPDGSSRDIRMNSMASFLPTKVRGAGDDDLPSSLMVLVFNLLKTVSVRDESNSMSMSGSMLRRDSSIISLDIEAA